MNTTILVMSDTHGAFGNILKAAQRLDACGGFDMLFFLGDGENDLARVKLPGGQRVVTVRGNCDFGSKAPDHTFVTVGRYKLLLAHGHTFSVKFGYERYAAFARANGADAALFGHTHIRHYEYNGDGRPLYLFNPGSASFSGSPVPGYGVITVTDGGLLFSFGEL